MNSQIIAHCGDQQNAPESTLAAFELAISKGADAIEFDVHFTSDQALIVHHDYYLGRTEQGDGFIGDYSLTQLKELDIGSWFNPKFSSERMLTFEEVIDLGKSQCRLEIDLRTPDEIFIAKILKAISDFGIEDQVEITSIHSPILHAVKRMNQKIRIGVFFQEYPNWMEEQLGLKHMLGLMALMDANVAHLPLSLLNEIYVSKIRKSGFLVHGSNLNSETDIKKGIEVDIDQFSTDNLDAAMRIRK